MRMISRAQPCNGTFGTMPDGFFVLGRLVSSAASPSSSRLVGDRSSVVLRPAVVIVIRLELARLGAAHFRLRPHALLARLDDVAFRPRQNRAFGEDEAEFLDAVFVRGDDDAHRAAVLQPAEQHLVGERRLDRLLDDARHRPRAHLLVIAVLDQPVARLVGELDRDIAFGKLGIELHDELVDDLDDHLASADGRRSRPHRDGCGTPARTCG